MNRDRTQRLGRGLAALLGEPGPSAGPIEIHNVAVDALAPNPHQPRGPIAPSSLEDLAASVRSQGILQPLLVRRVDADAHIGEKPFQIIAGERRWRAARIAGLSVVPCLVQPLDDHQSAAAALVENLQRLDLNALEEAQGYERLLARFHITQEALADVVGKSRSHVANTLRLLRLPDPVQMLVRAGTLSAGHARAILGHPNPVVAAKQIVAKGMSVRQAEAMVERAAEPEVTATASNTDPDIAAIERDLAEQLGLPVKLQAKDGRGSLTLRFSHLDQLDFLLARLGQSGLPR